MSNYSNDSENNDGDKEDNGDEDYNISDDEFYGDKKQYINPKFIDRSFTNLGYIGYGDGLNLEELDQTANWQFNDYK